MAVKYYFENENLEGDVYVGEFSNPSYVGDPIEINGDCFLSKDLSDNPFQPVQAKSCDVRLLATVEQPLDDIYNEDDRYWLFQLKKDGNLVFQGYASTEEMEQPYTAREWELNFSCLDHLSYLEQFGYYDAAGLPYTGSDTIFNIIQKCLEKGFNLTSEKLPFRLYHSLQYDSGSVFENLYLDQGQFYDEDGEAEDCLKIVNDILKSLGCFLEQYEGYFYIISVVDFAKLLATPITLDQYLANGTSDGTYVLSSTQSIQRIGSEIYGSVDIFHVNRNQSFYKKKFYNTFRTRHDFDYADQILPNGDLIQSGGSMPDWTLATGASVNGDTVEISGVELAASTAVALTSSKVSVRQNDKLTLAIDVEYVDDPTQVFYQLLLTDTVSGDDYSFYMAIRVDQDANSRGEWLQLPVGGLVEYRLALEFVSEGEYIHEITTTAIPEDGNIQFIAWRPIFGGAFTASSKSILSSVTLSGLELPIEAEEYTYSRTDKTTGAVPDVYDIRFNTSDRSILQNIYKDSSGDPISGLETPGGGTVSLLSRICFNHITLFQENQIVFKGDVKNNNGLTPKRIDNLGSPYITVRESKNIISNISQCQHISLSLNDSPPLNGELRRIYKETTKPKIVS